MSDITKCTNDKCPLRKDCYRFTAVPHEYVQAYAKFDFVNDEEVHCDFYYPNK